jgi:hypothetical protein
MTITIELPPGIEESLSKLAVERGSDPGKLIAEIVTRELGSTPPAEGVSAWRLLAELGASLSDEEKAKFPPDAAQNIDHYLYGLPKEEE